MPTKQDRYLMLETIRDSSLGKIYLEKEYARSIKLICLMLEDDGKYDEAANIIQEIQIETYGSIETKDKVDFILY